MMSARTTPAAATDQAPRFGVTAAVPSEPKRPQLIRDDDGTFHAIVFAVKASECLDVKAKTYGELCAQLEAHGIPRPLPHEQEPEAW